MTNLGFKPNNFNTQYICTYVLHEGKVSFHDNLRVSESHLALNESHLSMSDAVRPKKHSIMERITKNECSVWYKERLKTQLNIEYVI